MKPEIPFDRIQCISIEMLHIRVIAFNAGFKQVIMKVLPYCIHCTLGRFQFKAASL